jgi:[glutamine synthetase] adenylyltransferase / [glutamine synthetase]-adenylyl-L-tyrosine phosphorylase
MSAALADPFRDEGWTGAFPRAAGPLTNYPSFERLADDLKEMDRCRLR